MNDASVSAAPPARRAARRRQVWSWTKRVLGLAFLAGVAWLLAERIGSIDWPAVLAALRGYDALTLAGAAGLALIGYAAAASYDVLGRRYVGHALPAPRTFAINFIAYAFALNLGALIGGWGFRVRLYARHGLGARLITRIIVFAVVTNWSGFVLLTGLVFALYPPQLPQPWPLDATGNRVLGALLLLAVAAYLGLCAAGTRRHWALRVRGLELAAPRPPTALLQLALSSASWLLIALTMAHLLPPGIPFPTLLAAMFAASLIGAATHVPGSVGVLEGAMLVLLGGELDSARVLAALFAFRAVYYLVPLVIAALGYAALELSARRR